MNIESELRSARNAELTLAKKVLVTGHNPLINLAVQHGWARSLLDLLRSVAREKSDRAGHLPTEGEIDQFVMGTLDVLYYQAHGQNLLSPELDQIVRRRENAGLWWPVRLDVSHDRSRYRIEKIELPVSSTISQETQP